MKNIIEKVFNRKELLDQPPVLIDVGASGAIHKSWKSFSKYCICIAFDADDREFQVSEKDSEDYKTLYKFNCIVSDKKDDKLDFYLTKNPYCSSTLKPDENAVNKYIYDDGFTVVRKTTINNISLKAALEKLNINYVDWLKTDSQGTDLRIFTSLPEVIKNKIIVAEFEPGLAPSYKEDDSTFHVLAYMRDQNFWLSGFEVKGVPRGSSKLLESIFKQNALKKFSKHILKRAPKWVEMLYINNLNDDAFTIREYLLCCIFSMINHEYLSALELARKGFKKYNDDIFKSIDEACVREIRKSLFGKKVIKGAAKQMLRIVNK